MDEFRQFGSIISVTTDAILARCMNSPQPPGENRVARSIALKKIIGSAEKNRVGREPERQVFFLRPMMQNAAKISHTSFRVTYVLTKSLLLMLNNIRIEPRSQALPLQRKKGNS
jgi:hypothetical protein